MTEQHGTLPRRMSAGPRIPLAGVAFVSGLIGLLVANLVLGPLAVVLGVAALRRDPGRRSRAALGLVLGVADVAVFFLLAAHARHGMLG